MWRTAFTLQIQQQEKEPVCACVSVCEISNTCHLSIAHTVGMHTNISMI